MADDDSDDSDEWGLEELVIPPKGEKTGGGNTGQGTDADGDADVGDDYWEVKKNTGVGAKGASKEQEDDSNGGNNNDDDKGGEPMIIVDMTLLNPDIHSKFDRNSVNQPEEASALRKAIEKDYETYAHSSDYLSEGIVVPCGSSVWRGALVRLRDERPGHYFVPIFRPKTK